MKTELQLQTALDAWKTMSQTLQDDTHIGSMSDETFRMQKTETLLMTSIALRSISKRVREHAQTLRESKRS